MACGLVDLDEDETELFVVVIDSSRHPNQPGVS